MSMNGSVPPQTSPETSPGSSACEGLIRPPKRKYFDPNRYSLSSGSSTPSSVGSLSPPNLPFAGRVPSYASHSSMATVDSPYPGAGRPLSLGYQYVLSPDVRSWASEYTPDFKEADDDMYQPEPKNTRKLIERDGHVLSLRGLTDLGAFVLVILAILVLFTGYPLITHFEDGPFSTGPYFNLGGINASGQVPTFEGRFSLIDPDTPQSAYTRTAWNSESAPAQTYELVFSDEFNTDGRTFYPGDDPFWEAVDLHYWATNNLEWYDPAAVTTEGGNLVITLSQKQTHDLNYQGGLLSTWNKFCFTGGYVEANVSLPGLNNVAGLWPAIWTMGNLGRAGYGASLEGVWPYSYDSCDVGTVANQSINGEPLAATINGDKGEGGVLSYLPGQKLSRCTCDGESHPGPKHPDGTFVGRAAPEIDMFEAQATRSSPSNPGILTGQVSQSAQWAPFDAGYIWQNVSNEIIADPTISVQNTYIGSATQQATSVVTDTDPLCYEGTGGCYSVYGFEYKPGFDNAYITWISDNKVSWTMKVAGVGANPETEISARPVSQEPMYLIANLGMSHNFGQVDLSNIPFPAHLRIDYIRVYQPTGHINIGCNPPEFPTEDYINQHIEAYTNPNLTTWRGDYGQPWPRNSYLGEC